MSPLENYTKRKVVKKRARDNDDDSVNEREEEGKREDRLSSWPDCVLIHLMTFMTTKDSVRTTVLSKRYKDLWKRVPSLALDSCDFRTLTNFKKLVSKVLSLRDGSVPLQSLCFDHYGHIPPQLLTRVVRYAVSHNIQQLIFCLGGCRFDLPPCIYSCQTLTSLDLSVFTGASYAVFPRSLNLTALTSLFVRYFEFCADENQLVEPFSACVKLRTLVIEHCHISHSQILCISNATLVNLTMHASAYCEEARKIVLSTPSLCSFTFWGVIAQQLTARNLSCLKEVNIDVHYFGALRHLQSTSILISWLQVFANVRSLIVSSSTLKVLSSIPDLLNTESPCSDNLKSLTIVKKSSSAFEKPLPIPDGVVDYLIQNSPFAKVTISNC